MSCGKVTYPTYSGAEKVAKSRKPKRMFVYRCRQCNGWHLSSVRLKEHISRRKLREGR